MASGSHNLDSPRKFQYSAAPAVMSPSGSGGPALLPEVEGWGGESWRWTCLVLGAVALCILYFFSTNMLRLLEIWAKDAGWSHGFVVPLISLFFIRLKWEQLQRLRPAGSLWGLAVLAVGTCSQVLFRATGVEHMSCLSIVVVLYGVALFVLGWEYLKILWLPIGYLVFALPPPTALYVAMTMPMQRLAAELGVQLLPLFGGDGVRHGTVIDVIFSTGRAQLEVAQACSGMRMLIAFFALAVALGYSTERPVWQKVALAACALPIAILCNCLRVTLTGVLAVKVSPDWATGDAHGFFGLAMLLPAMAMQLGVAWVLDRIFVEEKPGEGGTP